jgi:hypothetical protein
MEENVWVICQNLLLPAVVQMDMMEKYVKAEVRLIDVKIRSLNFRLFAKNVVSSVVYPCDSSPCENGGICANTENSFKCTCTEKFEGVSCETRGLFTAWHFDCYYYFAVKQFN